MNMNCKHLTRQTHARPFEKPKKEMIAFLILLTHITLATAAPTQNDNLNIVSSIEYADTFQTEKKGDNYPIHDLNKKLTIIPYENERNEDISEREKFLPESGILYMNKNTNANAFKHSEKIGNLFKTLLKISVLKNLVKRLPMRRRKTIYTKIAKHFVNSKQTFSDKTGKAFSVMRRISMNKNDPDNEEDEFEEATEIINGERNDKTSSSNLITIATKTGSHETESITKTKNPHEEVKILSEDGQNLRVKDDSNFVEISQFSHQIPLKRQRIDSNGITFPTSNKGETSEELIHHQIPSLVIHQKTLDEAFDKPQLTDHVDVKASLPEQLQFLSPDHGIQRHQPIDQTLQLQVPKDEHTIADFIEKENAVHKQKIDHLDKKTNNKISETEKLSSNKGVVNSALQEKMPTIHLSPIKEKQPTPSINNKDMTHTADDSSKNNENDLDYLYGFTGDENYDDIFDDENLNFDVELVPEELQQLKQSGNDLAKNDIDWFIRSLGAEVTGTESNDQADLKREITKLLDTDNSIHIKSEDDKSSEQNDISGADVPEQRTRKSKDNIYTSKTIDSEKTVNPIETIQMADLNNVKRSLNSFVNTHMNKELENPKQSRKITMRHKVTGEMFSGNAKDEPVSGQFKAEGEKIPDGFVNQESNSLLSLLRHFENRFIHGEKDDDKQSTDKESKHDEDKERTASKHTSISPKPNETVLNKVTLSERESSEEDLKHVLFQDTPDKNVFSQNGHSEHILNHSNDKDKFHVIQENNSDDGKENDKDSEESKSEMTKESEVKNSFNENSSSKNGHEKLVNVRENENSEENKIADNDSVYVQENRFNQEMPNEIKNYPFDEIDASITEKSKTQSIAINDIDSRMDENEIHDDNSDENSIFHYDNNNSANGKDVKRTDRKNYQKIDSIDIVSIKDDNYSSNDKNNGENQQTSGEDSSPDLQDRDQHKGNFDEDGDSNADEENNPIQAQENEREKFHEHRNSNEDNDNDSSSIKDNDKYHINSDQKSASDDVDNDSIAVDDKSMENHNARSNSVEDNESALTSIEIDNEEYESSEDNDSNNDENDSTAEEDSEKQSYEKGTSNHNDDFDSTSIDDNNTHYKNFIKNNNSNDNDDDHSVSIENNEDDHKKSKEESNFYDKDDEESTSTEDNEKKHQKPDKEHNFIENNESKSTHDNNSSDEESDSIDDDENDSTSTEDNNNPVKSDESIDSKYDDDDVTTSKETNEKHNGNSDKESSDSRDDSDNDSTSVEDNDKYFQNSNEDSDINENYYVFTSMEDEENDSDNDDKENHVQKTENSQDDPVENSSNEDNSEETYTNKHNVDKSKENSSEEKNGSEEKDFPSNERNFSEENESWVSSDENYNYENKNIVESEENNSSEETEILKKNDNNHKKSDEKGSEESTKDKKKNDENMEEEQFLDDQEMKDDSNEENKNQSKQDEYKSNENFNNKNNPPHEDDKTNEIDDDDDLERTINELSNLFTFDIDIPDRKEQTNYDQLGKYGQTKSHKYGNQYGSISKFGKQIVKFHDLRNLKGAPKYGSWKSYKYNMFDIPRISHPFNIYVKEYKNARKSTTYGISKEYGRLANGYGKKTFLSPALRSFWGESSNPTIRIRNTRRPVFNTKYVNLPKLSYGGLNNYYRPSNIDFSLKGDTYDKENYGGAWSDYKPLYMDSDIIVHQYSTKLHHDNTQDKVQHKNDQLNPVQLHDNPDMFIQSHSVFNTYNNNKNMPLSLEGVYADVPFNNAPQRQRLVLHEGYKEVSQY